MVVLLEGSPISTEELRSSVRVAIRFLVTSLIAQFAWAASLVVPNFLHLRMMEATVFVGIFNAE